MRGTFETSSLFVAPPLRFLLLLVGIFGLRAAWAGGADSAPRAARREAARSPTAPAQECAEAFIFPLAADARLLRDFGDPRGRGRTHEGMDLIAPKMTEVRAVASGTVSWMHDERGGRCCDVEIEHDDGWSARYIHLNNDSPGTDDGEGWGFVDGLRPGSRVEQGQVIGWVGDSGNAEAAGSHLHFELRRPDGHAVDPYDTLARARGTDQAPASG
jgi:murein DD-endopeptidase MepM/ murein hydrolase activator NlpD